MSTPDSVQAPLDAPPPPPPLGPFDPRADADGRYGISANRIGAWHNKKDRDGDPVYVADGSVERTFEAIANFAAIIVEELKIDDGADSHTTFVIEGRRGDGTPLERVRVAAADFDDLKWLPAAWGTRAVIRSKDGNRPRFVEAVKVLSEGYVVRRTVFTHSGWRFIDNRPVYLHAGGGVDANGHVAGISVELPDGLAKLRLPEQPADIADAMRVSLSVLDVAPLEVTAALLAAPYLAVVSALAKVNFMLHAVGETGSRKSTLAALAMQHFGENFGTTTGGAVELPADWLFTYSSLENQMFNAKDALLVIDDYKHQHDGQAQKRLEAKAADLVRSVGNRTARVRSSWMGAGRAMKTLTPHPPRGLTLSTGEIVPRGHSDVARLLTIPVEKGAVDLAKLSILQVQSPRLTHAMRGFVEWVAQHFDHLAVELPMTIARFSVQFRDAEGFKPAHERLAGNLAQLLVGLDLCFAFAEHVGAIDAAKRSELFGKAREALLRVGDAQNRVIRDADPAEKFVDVLRTLIAAEKVRFRPRGEPRSTIEITDPAATFIGWEDAKAKYVLADEAIRLVTQFVRDSGGTFPATKESLLRSLAKLGHVEAKQEGSEPYLRAERVVRCQGKATRVLVMPLATLRAQDADCEGDSAAHLALVK